LGKLLKKGKKSPKNILSFNELCMRIKINKMIQICGLEALIDGEEPA
jgi:hypothetical protein